MKKYQILLTAIFLVAAVLTGCTAFEDSSAPSASPDAALSGVGGESVSSGDTAHENSGDRADVSAEIPVVSDIPADTEDHPSSAVPRDQSSQASGVASRNGQSPSQKSGGQSSSPTRSSPDTTSPPANSTSSRAASSRATSPGTVSSKSASSKPKETASSRTPSKEPATITVTLSVDCKTAVAYGSELAASISNNGVILSGKTIALDRDATVYDALKKSGLVIGARSSAAGQYVHTIQSLQEKTCGGKSGWVYFVNGAYVSKSSSACTLKDGDSVQWRYTCNNGKDL